MHELRYMAVDTILRDQIERNRTWIEQTLSAPISETIQLDLPFNPSRWAARHILHQTLNEDATESFDPEYYRPIKDVLLPPEGVPYIKLERKPKTGGSGEAFDYSWSTDWRECHLALCFDELQHPVVVLNTAYSIHGERRQKEVTLVRRDSVQGLLSILAAHKIAMSGPKIVIYRDGPVDLTTAEWDDVMMDERATKLLRDDFLSFFKRRDWFREKKLPFRRGYLLHGPPGNGKTSALRAMLSYPGITGHSIDLMARHMEDSDLRQFFKYAAADAPALILFEDIDRFFSRKPEEEASSVSLQQFLNCLDGVDTLDGVIVVATANNPEALDTAILRRPGRFDRVIEFGNPSEKLRAKYLHNFCPELAGEDLDICALASEGLSFAQLRESYILAAQTAYEANRNVTPDDISSAIALLQVSMNRADRKRTQKSGFEAEFGPRLPMSRT